VITNPTLHLCARRHESGGRNNQKKGRQILIAAALGDAVTFTTTVAQAAVPKWRDFQFGGM
jgi:hypothetical protein